jgi:replication factor A1
MATIGYEAIIVKICDEKKVSRVEVEQKIKDKLNQLSDLISKDGAAHIVANEMGVKVYETFSAPKKVTIQELNPILKNVEMVVKVLKLNEIRSFKTAAREGRVANVLIGDETGTCRLVVWDEKQIKEIEEGKIKEGCTLKVSGCYVRENNFGGKEVHMGSTAVWEVNPEGQVIGEVKQKIIEKKSIKDLKENESATLTGTIVQIFEPKFFDACPQCGKKVEFKEEGFSCVNHGLVASIPQPVLSIIFDDGTDSIRVSCFRENVKKILEHDNLIELRDDPDKFREVQRKVAGKQLKITGNVKFSSYSNKLELSAVTIEDANPRELASEFK